MKPQLTNKEETLMALAGFDTFLAFAANKKKGAVAILPKDKEEAEPLLLVMPLLFAENPRLITFFETTCLEFRNFMKKKGWNERLF